MTSSPTATPSTRWRPPCPPPPAPTSTSALDVLDDRERAILRMRYGLDGRDPLTLEQVGVAFSLTRERIRQIEVKALSKLRHPSQAERFMSLALP